jgi:hypothetical protein
MARVETGVYGSTLILQHAHTDFYSGFTHTPYALTIYFGVGILGANNYSLESMLYYHVATGWCLAPVRAWLQCNVHGTFCKVFRGFSRYIVLAVAKCCVPPRDTDTPHGIYFGMGTSVFSMVAFANNAIVAYYHGSNHRIGGCACFSTFCQLYGSEHVLLVCCHSYCCFVMSFLCSVGIPKAFPFGIPK